MEGEPKVEIARLEDADVERASLFARNNFQDSLAIFYNDSGVEQFHDSVSDMAISERMRQLSNFFLVSCEGRLVGLFELHRIRHITLLLLEAEMAKDAVVSQIVDFIRGFVDEREFDHYMTVHAPPSGYPIFKRLGFKVTGEEHVYCGGICSTMKLVW